MKRLRRKLWHHAARLRRHARLQRNARLRQPQPGQLRPSNRPVVRARRRASRQPRPARGQQPRKRRTSPPQLTRPAARHLQTAALRNAPPGLPVAAQNQSRLQRSHPVLPSLLQRASLHQPRPVARVSPHRLRPAEKLHGEGRLAMRWGRWRPQRIAPSAIHLIPFLATNAALPAGGDRAESVRRPAPAF